MNHRLQLHLRMRRVKCINTKREVHVERISWLYSCVLFYAHARGFLANSFEFWQTHPRKKHLSNRKCWLKEKTWWDEVLFSDENRFWSIQALLLNFSKPMYKLSPSLRRTSSAALHQFHQTTMYNYSINQLASEQLMGSRTVVPRISVQNFRTIKNIYVLVFTRFYQNFFVNSSPNKKIFNSTNI